MHNQKEMTAQIDKVKINYTRKRRVEATRGTEKLSARNSLVFANSVAVMMNIEQKMLCLGPGDHFPKVTNTIPVKNG